MKEVIYFSLTCLVFFFTVVCAVVCATLWNMWRTIRRRAKR